jgi:hypothetical protein
MKFEVGQIWKDREDSLWTITSTTCNKVYPVQAKQEFTNFVQIFTECGQLFETVISPFDLIELVHAIPKKPLNFWEAREAALAGKKVRRPEFGYVFTIEDFKNYTSWHNTDLAAEWEIVEEPKRYTHFIYPTPDTTIAVIYDENGKFVKGENI